MKTGGQFYKPMAQAPTIPSYGTYNRNLTNYNQFTSPTFNPNVPSQFGTYSAANKQMTINPASVAAMKYSTKPAGQQPIQTNSWWNNIKDTFMRIFYGQGANSAALSTTSMSEKGLTTSGRGLAKRVLEKNEVTEPAENFEHAYRIRVLKEFYSAVQTNDVNLVEKILNENPTFEINKLYVWDAEGSDLEKITIWEKPAEKMGALPVLLAFNAALRGYQVSSDVAVCDLSILNLLVKRGANLNIRDHRGRTLVGHIIHNLGKYYEEKRAHPSQEPWQRESDVPGELIRNMTMLKWLCEKAREGKLNINMKNAHEWNWNIYGPSQLFNGKEYDEGQLEIAIQYKLPREIIDMLIAAGAKGNVQSSIKSTATKYKKLPSAIYLPAPSKETIEEID